MTELLQFAAKHPFLTFFLFTTACYTATRPFWYAYLMFNRIQRSRNIAAHGWPPEHCDADGDFRSDDQ